MKDVVVTFPKNHSDNLEDKKSALLIGNYSWWNFNKLPREMTERSKVFITENNHVNGYFSIETIDKITNQVYFDRWQDIEDIGSKSQQGFKYRDFEYIERR